MTGLKTCSRKHGKRSPSSPRKDLNQTYYEPQIEVITAAQMLDAYTSVGMPIMYRHWSFGKELVQSVSPEESAQLEFKFMCDDVPRQACKAKDCV